MGWQTSESALGVLLVADGRTASWPLADVLCRSAHHTHNPHNPTPQDGINPQWQAFYFANTKYPLQAVRLNGDELQRNEFQVRQRGAVAFLPPALGLPPGSMSQVPMRLDRLQTQTSNSNFKPKQAACNVVGCLRQGGRRCSSSRRRSAVWHVSTLLCGATLSCPASASRHQYSCMLSSVWPNPPASQPQFWVHPAPLSSPATFEFEAVNGAKVSATVADALGKNVTVPNFP